MKYVSKENVNGLLFRLIKVAFVCLPVISLLVHINHDWFSHDERLFLDRWGWALIVFLIVFFMFII